MNWTADFFTLYWIVYFPTCIVYYNHSSFSYIDEVMTVVLMAVTFLGGTNRYTNHTPWKEYIAFLCILAFYIAYSLMMQVNVSGSVWLDLVQQIRPFSIIYCTWILNPQFSEKQKKWMLGSMLVSIFSFVFYNPAVGKVHMVPLGQIAISTAMTYYLFTEETKKNLWITVLIATVGLLSMKSKYYGEYGVFIALLFFMKEKLDFSKAESKVKIAALIAIAIFLAWDRFDVYFVSGLDNEELARPMTYKAGFKILWDYFPFGSGMGTFATNAADRFYSPLYVKYGLNHVWGLGPGGGFICDAFYPSLAEFGVVGIILFIIFWKRRLKNINDIEDFKYYLVGLMTIFCLAIEQTADSSWLSGKGMGYCMLIGLCLNANRNKELKEEEQFYLEEEERR